MDKELRNNALNIIRFYNQDYREERLTHEDIVDTIEQLYTSPLGPGYGNSFDIQLDPNCPKVKEIIFNALKQDGINVPEDASLFLDTLFIELNSVEMEKQLEEVYIKLCKPKRQMIEEEIKRLERELDNLNE